MKQFYLLFLSFVFALQLNSQSAWPWAKRFGTNAGEAASAIAIQPNGDVIVAGVFTGPSLAINSFTLLNSGSSNEIFITKLDASGNVLWASSTGHDDNDWPAAIACDAAGNIFITGHFYNTSLNAENLYLTKFNSSGVFQWSLTAVGGGDHFARGLATDASGNVYITGDFNGPSLTFSNTTITNSFGGNPDIFLVKFNNNGNILWANPSNNSEYTAGYGVAVDADNNVYVTGGFAGPYYIIGNDTLLNSNVNTPPSQNLVAADMFLAKYNSAGMPVWARSIGGAEYDEGKVIRVAGNNIYVGGEFTSSNLAVTGSSITNNGAAGTRDVFLAEYTLNGSFKWLQGMGGASRDNINGIATNSSGDVMVTGHYSVSAMNVGSSVLSNNGGTDIFLAQFSSEGTFVSSQSFGGTLSDEGYGIDCDISGNIYFAGCSSANSLFVGANSLQSCGSYDAIVAKGNNMITGIFSLKKEPSQIMVHPNPSTGYFLVDVSGFSGPTITLSLYNVTGRLITEKIVAQSQSHYFVDVSSENEGIYFLKLSDEYKTITNTLVVKK